MTPEIQTFGFFESYLRSTRAAKMGNRGKRSHCDASYAFHIYGHKSVSATSRYLPLTAEVYPELLSTIEEKCAFVIPEVQNEEI